MDFFKFGWSRILPNLGKIGQILDLLKPKPKFGATLVCMHILIIDLNKSHFGKVVVAHEHSQGVPKIF